MLKSLRRLAPPALPSLLLDLVYPRRCIAADCAAAGQWICPACLARIGRLGPSCPRCALPRRSASYDAEQDCAHCRDQAPAFDAAHAYGPYEGLLKRAILDLKYGRRIALAPTLAGLAAAATSGPRSLAPDSLVIALPAHRARTRQRGVDHSARIARSFAQALGFDLASGLLLRHRDTRPQVGLSLLERRQNVAGAFRGGGDFHGRPVILVDDVMTTGASASSAAEALKAAGAGRVTVCTVARAVPGRVGGARPPSL
jgi:predicted amidophosphoribosyltransferase